MTMAVKFILMLYREYHFCYYVIGFIEAGTRCLSCKNKEYTVSQGNILLFNPNPDKPEKYNTKICHFAQEIVPKCLTITTVVCNATAELLITEV